MVWARHTDKPPKLRRSRPTAAMKAGIKYEKEVIKRLGCDVLAGQWFVFRQKDQPLLEYCQVDAILLGKTHNTLIEIKLRHCLEAWHQLYNLYKPVYTWALQQAAMIEKPVHCVEIVRWFDPLVVTPHLPHRIKSLDETCEDKFNVMVMK